MRGNGGGKKPAGSLQNLLSAFFPLEIIWEWATSSSLPLKLFFFKVVQKEKQCQGSVFQAKFPKAPQQRATPEPRLSGGRGVRARLCGEVSGQC